MAKEGEIYRVAGPVVTATGISPKMYDVMQVGEEADGRGHQDRRRQDGHPGLRGDLGHSPGEKVIDTGQPLVAELGPGLLGSVYDGIQRPLPVLMSVMGDFIKRGVSAPGLDHKVK